MAEPKILVAGSPDRTDYYRPYLEAVRGAGGDPGLDWPDAAERSNLDATQKFLQTYRGILFPGGADIDPAWYGAENRASRNIDAELDEAQLALARAALAEDLPILGICRGLQLLAVALGAKLYQDLPSERPSTVEHLDRESKTRLIHAVKVDPDSRLAALSGAVRFEVNSRHHQAVREDPAAVRIGPLQVVARAADGVIEGLEDPRRRFSVAVQWHPENLVASHAPSQNLFRGFIAACRT